MPALIKRTPHHNVLQHLSKRLFLSLHLIKYSVVEAYRAAKLMPSGNYRYCSAALWVLFTDCSAFVRLSIVTELKGVANCGRLMGRNREGKTLLYPCGCYEMVSGVVVNLMGCVLCGTRRLSILYGCCVSNQVTRLVHFSCCLFPCR